MDMSKMKRNERIGAIVKVLCGSPNEIYTLSHFTEMFNSAKSTISEDLTVVKKIMEDLKLGKVETIAGAAGGVKYIPFVSNERKLKLMDELCAELRDPARVIPGGFLYIADLLYNPKYVRRIAEIFAEMFSYKNVDFVMTVETKGIPVAMMTAADLNVPLVIARNENKISEGSKISINYVSGSTGKVQTMYLSKKAIPKGSNVLIIDDFMRAGGTIKGMVELVKELGGTVAGTGVILETKKPEAKMVEGYISILRLEDIKDGEIDVTPNKEILR